MASAMEDGEEERETEGKTVSILSITVMTCILMVELELSKIGKFKDYGCGLLVIPTNCMRSLTAR